jgi:hypothetical protein
MIHLVTLLTGLLVLIGDVRNRVKKFLLSGIAENVKECQIVSYLKRNITPTYISVFPSKRKGTTSAKIHFRSAPLPIVR